MTKTPAKDILDKLAREDIDKYTKEEWGERQRKRGYDQGFDDAAEQHRQTIDAVELLLHGAAERLYKDY